MAHILQTNISPEFIPVFCTELLDLRFDDADLELLEVGRTWAEYEEREEA